MIGSGKKFSRSSVLMAGLVGLVLSFQVHAEPRPAPPLMFRAPMAKGPAFKMPDYIKNGASETERLMRFQNLMSEFRVRDSDMLSTFRNQAGELKVDRGRAEAFAKEFEAKTVAIERALAASDMKGATDLLAARERLYDEFLKDSKGMQDHHIRPGEIKELGDIGGMLVFAKSTGGTLPGEKPTPGTPGKDDHGPGSTSGGGGVDATAAIRMKGVRDLWGMKDGTCSGGFCSSLQKALGGGAVSKDVTTKVNKAIDKWLSSGNFEYAERFITKLKDVVDFVNTKLGGRGDAAKKGYLTDILGEILKSRGVTAETFAELEKLSDAKGADVDALQGLHRMAQILKNLREAFEKSPDTAPKGKELVEGTAERDAWLTKRDAWVGEKLQRWVDYGEEFRASVAGEAGKAKFDLFVKGEHEQDKKAETDPTKRPDKALGCALEAGGCAGWMRKAPGKCG